MTQKDSYILVIGASIVDILGFTRNIYKGKDSNPGNIKISLGGVCRNISENLARVGVNTKFISIIGDDENGRNILSHSKMVGYDMEESLILEGGCTPTYMAILDHTGDMVSAVVDMESLDEMDTDFIDSKKEAISNAEYTILDADDAEMLEYILTTYKGKTKFVLDPVSAAKAEKIKHLIKYFHTIKPNRYEAEILCGFPIKTKEDLDKAGDYFLSQGVENVFISLDADGIYYMNNEETGKIKAKNVTVKNTTGAGDSFVAGVGYGYMNNLSLKDTVKYAIAMSTITISHEDTINPKMSDEYVELYLNKIEWEEDTY
ncbi:carbohydrate kinase family protein [Clostridium sardiniense]|uniref:Carbohydrate kinase family protein n=1 Tax=Clostridium sardiniense TaxID=29369 RepID=A0ABS7KVP9_CLOSR|nr:carbohydrate kinase family protein [Clostridium sardiniense]MBY0754881.1 carbohydrate kinase family protein [Clostridium sardiniense]MDQ0461706.1 sugar/nucleoside kinase (ribokinase family) [Clostridium sardiniense]